MVVRAGTPRGCMVFLMRRELAWSAILWSQNFDSMEWTTVFIRDVGGGLCSF